jgi:hypothetical protein
MEGGAREKKCWFDLLGFTLIYLDLVLIGSSSQAE